MLNWQSRSVKFLTLFALLGVASYFGNRAHLPILFGLNFQIGSIFVLLALQWLSPVWGVVLAAIASGLAYLFSDSPWVAIIFIAEATFVGWRLQRSRNDLILADSLYWLLVGIPSSGLLYSQIPGIAWETLVTLTLVRACNGIFNAAVASVLARILPFETLAVLKGESNDTEIASSPYLQKPIFNFLFAGVCFPILAFAAVASWQSAWMLEAQTQTRLAAAGTALERDALAWFDARQDAIDAMTRHANSSGGIASGDRRESACLTAAEIDTVDGIGIDRALVVPPSTPAPTGGKVCSRVDPSELAQLLQRQALAWDVEVDLLDAKGRDILLSGASASIAASAEPASEPPYSLAFKALSPTYTHSLGDRLPGQLRVRPSAASQQAAIALLEKNYSRQLLAILAIWGLALAVAERLNRRLAAPSQEPLFRARAASDGPIPAAVASNHTELAPFQTQSKHRQSDAHCAAPIGAVDVRVGLPALALQGGDAARWRAFADALPACIAYIDADCHYRFANRTHKIWFGLEPTAMEGRCPQQVFNESAAAAYLPYLNRALQGELVQFETQMGDRAVSVILTPDLDGDGAIVGCYALTTDISNLKYVVTQAQQARDFLQATLDALPVAISVKDVRFDCCGKYLFWNQASEDLFAISAGHAVGRTDGHLFPAARVKTIAASESEALACKQPTEMQFEDVDRATSEPRTLRILNIPLLDAENRPQYLLSYTEDVTPRLRAEMMQRERDRYWENLIGATTDALLVICNAGQICFHNPAAERLFGRSAAELKNYEFGRVLPSKKREFTEIEILQPDGRFVFAQMRVADIDWEGKPALLASLTDVTERHAAEVALRRREANYRGLVDNLDAGVAVFAPDTSIMLCNAKTCELFDLPAAELLGKRLEELSRHWYREDGTPLLPEDYPVNQVLQQGVPLRQFVFGISHERGDRTWVLANAFPEFDQEQQLQQIVVTFTDISSLKQAETRLRHAALHDSLTGLPNRTLLVERLDRALKHAHRHSDYWFAVLFIDLDRFKTINDSLGHQVGDLLLLEVAHCLQSIVRANDTVCRLGGDEFVVLLDGVCDAREVSYIAERIQESLQGLRQIDGCEIATSASIGIALSQTTYTSADEMLRDADTAMYRAKASGRARSEIFDRVMHEQVLERFQLETSLRRALERDEFVLNYQPIVSYQDRQILGFEALVRWQHPELGYLSPGKFIPIAEETGLIVPLGLWVLETACRCLRDWQDRFPEATATLKMGVNVSARQLQERDFLATIDRTLFDVELPPQCLNIEVTEGSLLGDVDRTIDTLRALRQRRVGVSIDDFGTGYSSLSYLKRFPIDTLKIDRSFVDGLGTFAEDERIVEAIVTLARTFGLGVVAEGVETELQLARIEAMGCRAIQGNWFASPLDARAAEELLVACNQPAGKPC